MPDKKREYAGRGAIYRRHANASLHLERQPDGSVRGRCYLFAYNGKPGELPHMADCARYEDTLVKTPEGWRFQHRRLFMDGTTFRPPRV
ncbi:MAG: hypothetical protein FJX68_18245 [Alphaproteobacteria bacterium]|nr:hypothetical protein [Alphaproteobacteria bacterium]